MSKNKHHKMVAVVIELLIIVVVVNNYNNDPISASLQGLPGLTGSTGLPVRNDVYVKFCLIRI